MAPPPSNRQTEIQLTQLKGVIGRLYTLLKPGFDDPDPRWVAERNARVGDLKHHVHGLVKTYLDEWKEQVDAALTDVKPSDDKSRFYWYVALAGNLLWAATCFINPGAAVSASAIHLATAGRDTLGRFAARTALVEVQTSASAQRLIQLMSVGGALIGSGTAEQFAGLDAKKTATFNLKIGHNTEKITVSGDPEADGRHIARLVLANKRGELEELYRPLEMQWALEIDALAQWGGDVDELMDNYLWMKLFPRIPYVKRFVTIHELALKNMKSAIEDYNRQWDDWLFRKERSRPEWKHRRMYGEDWDYSVPDPGPFQPKLKFEFNN